MSFFNGTIFSHSLGMMTNIAVSLPSGSKFDESEDSTKSDGFPVIYLLHGLSDNYSAWWRRTNIDLYAEEAGFAVVMPEVQKSFYADMEYGANYFEYISRELPELCKSMFNITDDPKKTFVAGLSMGGYGAMKAALTFPQKYGAVASFSGALDIHSRLETSLENVSPNEVYAVSENEKRPENDLFHLLKNAAEKQKVPNMYITCGTEDFLYEDNQRFLSFANDLSAPLVYEEWTGGHEWDFWDESIKRAIVLFEKFI